VFGKRFFARRQMRPRAASLTLVLQVAPSIPIPIPRRKKLASEPDFERPPLWIHASVAGFLAGAQRKVVSSKREAKRRELLKLLDRIPAQAGDTARVQKQAGKAAAPIDIPVSAKAPLPQPPRDK
jgi:hypothetical protein